MKQARQPWAARGSQQAAAAVANCSPSALGANKPAVLAPPKQDPSGVDPAHTRTALPLVAPRLPLQQQDMHNGATAVELADQPGSSRVHANLTRQIKACTSCQQLFKLFVRHSNVLNGINTAAMVHHMSKLVESLRKSGRVLTEGEAQDLQDALHELHDFAEQELPGMGPVELANTAYGLAKMGVLSRRFVQLLVARTPPQRLSNQGLANVLWAVARAGHRPADSVWVQGMVQHLVTCAPTMKHKELAISMWALAKLNLHPGTRALDCLFSQVQQRTAFLLPIDLSNIMWSLAVFRYRPAHPGALAGLYAACADKACSMGPQNCATILWSMSAAGWQAPSAFIPYLVYALASHLPSPGSSAADRVVVLSTAGTSRTRPWAGTTPRESHVQQQATNAVDARAMEQDVPANSESSSSVHDSQQGGNLGTSSDRISTIVPGVCSSSRGAGVCSTGSTAAAAGGASPPSYNPPSPSIPHSSAQQGLSGGLGHAGSQMREIHYLGQAGGGGTGFMSRDEGSPGAVPAPNLELFTALIEDMPCQLAGREGAYSRRVGMHEAALALQAMAALRYDPGPQVINGLMQVIAQDVWRCPAADLAGSMYSVSKLGYVIAPEVVREVLAASTVRLQAEFSPAQVTCLVVALAHQAAQPPDTWRRAVCRHMIQRLDTWGPKELSRTMWGLARLGLSVSGRFARVMMFACLHPGTSIVPLNIPRRVPPSAPPALPPTVPAARVTLPVAHLGRPVQGPAAADPAIPNHALCDGHAVSDQSDIMRLRIPSTPPATQPPGTASGAAPGRQVHPRVAHKHIANLMWSIPQLLARNVQGSREFERVNRDLLKHVEGVSLHMIRNSTPALHDSPDTARHQEPGSHQQPSAEHDAAAAGARSHEQQPDHGAGRDGAEKGRALPLPELLQMLQAFAQLGYQPSRAWRHAHGQAVSLHSDALSAEERMAWRDWYRQLHTKSQRSAVAAATGATMRDCVQSQ